MLAAGVRVVLVDHAEERLGEACLEMGTDAIPLVANLLDPKSVTGMMPQILERAGHLDIFHANAGSCVVGGMVLPDKTVGYVAAIGPRVGLPPGFGAGAFGGGRDDLGPGTVFVPSDGLCRRRHDGAEYAATRR